ncbi:16233_t:CDS:2, partial [Dentiscutata heterogama]
MVLLPRPLLASANKGRPPQWEWLEYLGDSVLEHCLLKIARGRYLLDYPVEVIEKAVKAMATNKILAAYAITL